MKDGSLTSELLSKTQALQNLPEVKEMFVEDVRELFEGGRPVRFNDGDGVQIEWFKDFEAFERWWKLDYGA